MSQENQKYWDREFAEWAVHKPFGDAYNDLVDLIQGKISELAATLTPASRILDIGSGANNSDYFKNLARPEQIFCLDWSTKMLTFQEGSHKIQADAGQLLPLQGDSINLCVSFFLMRYLSRNQQVTLLQEVQRILKPNSWFLIIDLPKNDYPQQITTFDPIDLVEEARKIGLKSLLGQMKERKISKYTETGFGGWSENYPYQCGVLSGQK